MNVKEFAERVYDRDGVDLNVVTELSKINYIVSSLLLDFVHSDDTEEWVTSSESSLAEVLLSIVALIHASGFDIEDMVYDYTGEAK
jgi:hypothetical protein